VHHRHDRPDLHNPITVDLLGAVQAETRPHGYRTIVVVIGEDDANERVKIEKLLEFRVEEIIAMVTVCPMVSAMREPPVPRGDHRRQHHGIPNWSG